MPSKYSNTSAPLDSATLDEDIGDRKNFTIEDFYNAFDNATEFINRHRDPTEDAFENASVRSPVIGGSTNGSSGSANGVNSSANGSSFLALEPHFSSSPAQSVQSSRDIKYPCTCDKGNNISP